jgi:hypothetical protein
MRLLKTPWFEEAGGNNHGETRTVRFVPRILGVFRCDYVAFGGRSSPSEWERSPHCVKKTTWLFVRLTSEMHRFFCRGPGTSLHFHGHRNPA